MFDNRLFYLSNSSFGGWVSFTFHLSKVLNAGSIIKIKDTNKGGSIFYGDIRYANAMPVTIGLFKNPIITAVDKAHYHLLKSFKNATIVIHDPTELSEEVIAFAKKNKVITIRESVSKLLKQMGIENTFLKHPFYRYKKAENDKEYNAALSRVDFDKNTDIICKANNLGANIKIYGQKNHLYYFHKLRQLNFDEYYCGQYSKDLKIISELYSKAKNLVDLSSIKNDGGGTQYTFLEAEYHNCGLILHKKWTDVPNSIYINGVNCYSVSNENELLEALNMPVLISNEIPSEDENNKWKNIVYENH